MINYIKGKLVGFKLNSQVQYGLLIIITLLAAALRFYKLGAWSFWIDEIFTLRATPHISEWPIARLPINLVLIRGALDLLGTSEWSARFAPALVGILTIPVLYFPVRKIFGPRVALISALLLAIAPWHLFWSQNARFYVLMMLFYNLGLLLFYIGLEEKHRWYLGLSLIFILLAIRERFLAIFLVPVIMSYIALLLILPYEKPQWLRLKYLVLIMLPVLAFGLYDLYSYVTIGYSQLLAMISIFVGNPIDSPIRILLLILFDIGVPIASLALFGGIYQTLNKNRSVLLLLSGAIIPVILLLALSPFVFVVDRYALITLPSWIILAAIAINELLRQMRQKEFVLAMGVLFLCIFDATGSHLLYYQINHGNRLDWRSAISYVETQRRESDFIVATRPELAAFYLEDEVISLRRKDQEIDPGTVVERGQRFWFVVDSEGIWSAQPNMKHWIETNSQLVDIQYLRVREQINLRIYLYDPNQPMVMN